MGESSPEKCNLIPITHIKKNKLNELIPENMWKEVPAMTRKQIDYVIKEVMSRKLARLAQQNMSRNVAWLFFRSMWLDNIKERKESRRDILT